MQKISQLICLIVFLVLVATSCMAQAVENQAEVDGRLHHLIKKRQNDCNCILPPLSPARTCPTPGGDLPCIGNYNLTNRTLVGTNSCRRTYCPHPRCVPIPIIGVAPDGLFRYNLSGITTLGPCFADMSVYSVRFGNCVGVGGPIGTDDYPYLGGIRIDGTCYGTDRYYSFDNLRFDDACSCYVCPFNLVPPGGCACYTCTK